MPNHIGLCILLVAVLAFTAIPCTGDDGVHHGNLVGTDALGRVLPTSKEVGLPRKDKFVGMFYFLWLGAHANEGPYDITKILASNPNAMNEPENSAWGPHNAFHHWGESIYGYYRSDDPWVLRKHAHLLADAGVDTVIFDASNGFTYKDEYMALCKEWSTVRSEGGRTPQIAFLCPFGNANNGATNTVKTLWDDLYSKGLYKDLWFKWKGKPLIMVDPASVDSQMREFFTFRQPIPSYYSGPSGPDQWGWLEVYPQHVFKDAKGNAEQMTVGVGQNGTNDRLCAFSEGVGHGRSWHGGKEDTKPNAVASGLNFQEQWDRALQIDPEFVFVTGWNEWIAMRLNEFCGVVEPVMFVDLFSQEYSRDIEPMKGGHGDSYYMQLVSNIRKYKGTSAVPSTGKQTTIHMDEDFSQWNSIQPAYGNHRSNMIPRKHPDYAKAETYEDKSIRNNIVLSKVARDAHNLYFYAKTSRPISSYTDPNWMMLFLSTDKTQKTGWEGYDFLINGRVVDDRTTILQRSKSGWHWEDVAKVSYRVKGNELELAIPKSALGIHGDHFTIDFKWADNIQHPGDIMDFYVSGDCAPIGRFNYRYQTK